MTAGELAGRDVDDTDALERQERHRSEGQTNQQDDHDDRHDEKHELE